MDCPICGNELLQTIDFNACVKWYCEVCKAKFLQRSLKSTSSAAGAVAEQLQPDIESQSQISKRQVPKESATVSSSNGKHQHPVSAKPLQDTDSQNSNTRQVHNHLEFYSPLTVFQTITNDGPDFSSRKKFDMTTRTVSISNELEPDIKAACLEPIERILTAEYKPPHFFVMQAAAEVASGVNNIDRIFDKSNVNTDTRMQQILEILQEGAKVTSFREKLALFQTPTQSPAKDVKEEQMLEINAKNEESNCRLIAQLLNTHRCFYNPPNSGMIPVKNLRLWPPTQPIDQEPPLPQFQSLLCSTTLGQQLFTQAKASIIKPVPAHTLKIPRHPLLCPETTCRRLIFLSDIKHFAVDHSHLPIERIAPFECKNFFLDTRLAHCGTSKCHFLYLLRNKIINFGNIEYKNLLPILIMSTRISFDQKLEHFLIWVTSISTEDLPISVSLTVWPRSGRFPTCHVLYSGPIYSIRNSQSAIDVWKSGRMLSLSAQDIAALTNNGKEMLNLQLSVH